MSERELFERWYEEAMLPTNPDWKRKDEDGYDYAIEPIAHAWIAWEARAKLAEREITQAKKEGQLKGLKEARIFMPLFPSMESAISALEQRIATATGSVG